MNPSSADLYLYDVAAKLTDPAQYNRDVGP